MCAKLFQSQSVNFHPSLCSSLWQHQVDTVVSDHLKVFAIRSKSGLTPIMLLLVALGWADIVSSTDFNTIWS